MTCPSSPLTLLQTAQPVDTPGPTMFLSDSASSVYSSSSDSSTAERDSPTTPDSTVALTFQRSISDSSDHGVHAPSDSSFRRSSPPHRPDSAKSAPASSDSSASYPEPVFSSIPTRRVQSSTAVFRNASSCANQTQAAMPSSPICTPAPSSPSPTSATFPRRIPSFPISRPIRPFDSISNAMGTAPKRVSPPLSRADSFGQAAAPPPPRPLPTHNNPPHTHPYCGADDKLHMKSKGLSVQTVGLETGKPKNRTNVLLAPPKNTRFQHGFFILDMTQDEFKTRAW